MPRKVILIGDPGIDGAFAITLALLDPDLEVVGLAATAGNVPAEQATRNVHILVEQLDPRRWPRLGAAFAVEKPGHLDGVPTLSVQFYDADGHSAFKVFLTFGGKPPTPERQAQFDTLRDRFRRGA